MSPIAREFQQQGSASFNNPGTTLIQVEDDPLLQKFVLYVFFYLSNLLRAPFDRQLSMRRGSQVAAREASTAFFENPIGLQTAEKCILFSLPQLEQEVEQVFGLQILRRLVQHLLVAAGRPKVASLPANAGKKIRTAKGLVELTAGGAEERKRPTARLGRTDRM